MGRDWDTIIGTMEKWVLPITSVQRKSDGFDMNKFDPLSD